MVGASRKYMNTIFSLTMKNGKGAYEPNVERLFQYRLGKLPKEKVLVCKEFTIEPTQRGGVNGEYTTI